MSEISVVIPTFDRPELLNETLTALTQQSLAPREVIVVDNGVTPSVLESGRFPFALRYYRICARAGVAQTRNFGAALASGKYVAFLDDDDFWERDYLERLAQLTTGVGATAAMIVARIDHLDRAGRHFFRFAGDHKSMEACFYFNPGYLGSAITVERATFLELGGFDPSFKTGEDRELPIRYMMNGRTIFYDANLIAINRVHDSSLSRHIDYVRDARQLLDKYRGRIGPWVRLKTLREAYKKSRKRRYVLHIAALKMALALLAPWRPRRQQANRH